MRVSIRRPPCARKWLATDWSTGQNAQMFNPKDSHYVSIQEVKSSTTPFFVLAAFSQPNGIGKGVLIEYHFIGVADVSQHNRAYLFTPKPNDNMREDNEFFSALLQNLIQDSAAAALKLPAKDVVLTSVEDVEIIAATLAFPAIKAQLELVRKHCNFPTLADALEFPANFNTLVDVQVPRIEVKR